MRVRMNLVQWGLVVLPFLSAAQPKQLITSARSGDPARQSSTTPNRSDNTRPKESVSDATEADRTGVSINSLPLFGERPKTATQIDAEIHFLNDCDKNFGSRTEASDFFASRGWDYIAGGQLDTATHRFNLSWLLNDRNADAYWGLGVVCYQKNLLPTAIQMLKRGLGVADSNAVLMTDLATVQIKHYQENPLTAVLAEAEDHLHRAVSLNPGNATSYQKLSLVHYLKSDYVKAWAYLHQAHSLDLASLDLVYLNQLLTKQPDPKGIFK